jgi:hypothetical protein
MPFFRNNVVHGAPEHVLLIGQPEKLSYDRRPACEIEHDGPPGFLQSELDRRFRIRLAAQVVRVQLNGVGLSGCDPLGGSAVDDRELRPHHLAPSDDAVQRSPQNASVKFAREPDGVGYVVLVASVADLLDQHEPLLPERK